jgi:hypothetical protein
LVGKYFEKRLLGKSRNRLADNIKIYLQKVQWQDLVFSGGGEHMGSFAREFMHFLHTTRVLWAI